MLTSLLLSLNPPSKKENRSRNQSCKEEGERKEPTSAITLPGYGSPNPFLNPLVLHSNHPPPSFTAPNTPFTSLQTSPHSLTSLPSSPLYNLTKSTCPTTLAPAPLTNSPNSR